MTVINAFLITLVASMATGCLSEPLGLSPQENPAAFMKKVLEISTFDADADSVLDPADERKHPDVNEATRAEYNRLKSKRTAGELQEALELADKLIKNVVAALETRAPKSFNLQKFAGALQYERILILKQQFEFKEALVETRKYASLCSDLEICSPALANKLIDVIKTDPKQTSSLQDILLKRRAKLESQS